MSTGPSPMIYLLSGNGSCRAWWQDALPHFRDLKPVPLELPGYGDNPSDDFRSLDDLADALLKLTLPGHPIFAVGINALVALRAQVRAPGHFSHLILLAPVGAFLEERRFVSLLRMPFMASFSHFLLKRFPKLFRRKFSSRTWTDAQYRRMAEGYRKCRAFPHYFRFVQGWNALDLLEWVDSPITLIWGTGDNVLDVAQAAAWDTLLPRADLRVIIKPDWEHYPYIDNPQEFCEFLTQVVQHHEQAGFPAHTKAGRLQLATLAGLPVPAQMAVRSSQDARQASSFAQAGKLYAVRSSGATEDHIDHSNAGVNTTYLRVPAAEVEARALDLLQMGLATAVVQEFVEPRVSGVAFVRWVSAEVEMVEGHLEGLVSGTSSPTRVILSRLGGDWQSADVLQFPFPTQQGFDLFALWEFLRKAIRTFHYAHSDIEWAWDGQQFWLLQIRPVTAYTWRRSMSSANLDEILPTQVSRIMEHAQRRASLSIGRLYGLWDARCLQDNEPFTATADDASYLNLDLFLSRFHDWGLPGHLISREIGGAAPALPASAGRFLRSVPTFLRMVRRVRREVLGTEAQLRAFDRELAALEPRGDPAALAQWFVRYYVFIVRQNMVINACLSSSMGSFLARRRTVYAHVTAETHPHRLKFESDPSSPRPDVPAPVLEAFPKWNIVVKMLHRMGAPGLGGKYFEVREWFRDSNMRLFFRLHHALRGTPWLQPHEGIRTRSGAFWQDGGALLVQSHGFVIYPGKAEGKVGTDILIVDALDPGHLEEYKLAKAVIARTGGRLSHGATLLREIRKPSAVMPDAGDLTEGALVAYEDGKLRPK